MYSAILSFLAEVISNARFIPVMVNLISLVAIMHLSFAYHNIKALDVVDRKFSLIDK
jgi:hypothetical protein